MNRAVNRSEAAAATAAANNRGGAKAFPKTRINLDLLSDKFKEYVCECGSRNAFQLGEHQSIWSSYASRNKSLAELCPLLTAIMHADPRASVGYNDLKTGITNSLLAYPEAKPIKDQSLSAQASSLASQCLVVQNDLRKLSISDQSERLIETMMKELAPYPSL